MPVSCRSPTGHFDPEASLPLFRSSDRSTLKRSFADHVEKSMPGDSNGIVRGWDLTTGTRSWPNGCIRKSRAQVVSQRVV